MPPSTKPRVRPKAVIPHKIRIIGGQFKRTMIPVLDRTGLRPTPDRVRETLFNWITHLWDGEFEGRQVLDAFAGTGALGLEAVSRGVSSVVMIEHDRGALSALKALCDKLHISNVTLIAGDAMVAIPRQAPTRFDLIFLDPPFGADWLERAIPKALAVLADDGLLYIEAEAVMPPPPGMELLRIDRAGAVHSHLFRREPAAE
jgi:16S rRNA (guanine(966)-N(2))-methyltransferase RsmD